MDYGLAYPQQFRPAEPKPIPLRTQTSTPTSPKTLSFWAERPSFLYRTPSVTLFPPSLCLSPALCLYRGAVRAPLLKLLLKREHIQWGLSQSYSVSIEELGNTTLSREAFLKGQRDSGLSNLSASASHLSHGKQSTTKVFCFFFIKKISAAKRWWLDSARPSSWASASPHITDHRCIISAASPPVWWGSAADIYLDYSWWRVTVLV